MTFTLNAEVAAVLAAAIEQNGPPPAPPAGDVASRRAALGAMLEYFNNQAQPVASEAVVAAGPYCLVMLGDAIAAKKSSGDAKDTLEVVDVAQLLARSVPARTPAANDADGATDGTAAEGNAAAIDEAKR